MRALALPGCYPAKQVHLLAHLCIVTRSDKHCTTSVKLEGVFKRAVITRSKSFCWHCRIEAYLTVDELVDRRHELPAVTKDEEPHDRQGDAGQPEVK